MLTRIEIDGFKTFEKFALDLHPFTVILGTNASGKSNLFDAIRFLSRLAETDLPNAAKAGRGDPIDLFRRLPDGAIAKRMTIAAEFLLPQTVTDPWGKTLPLTTQRLRYEVIVARSEDSHGYERLLLSSEKVTAIARSDDKDTGFTARLRRDAPEFVKGIKYSGRRSPFLETGANETGQTVFKIKQDGTQGRDRTAPLANTTILASMSTGDFPHLYALREELRAIRFLELDASAMRNAVRFDQPDQLEPTGANLAAVLHRIKLESRIDTQPAGLLADIAADLAHLIPGMTGVDVVEDQRSSEYEIHFTASRQADFSGRVASEGTLRILALLTLLYDPKTRSTVCFEEPENGIHPSRLGSLIETMQSKVLDGLAHGDETGAFVQILCNSHSPVVLQALKENAGRHCVFFDLVTAIGQDGATPCQKTRSRLVSSGRQGEFALAENRSVVPDHEVERFLQMDQHAA